MRIRLVLTPFVAVAIAAATAVRPSQAQAQEKVLGLGGVFFRAKNPKVLADWYETHLGITKTPTSYDPFLVVFVD